MNKGPSLEGLPLELDKSASIQSCEIDLSIY